MDTNKPEAKPSPDELAKLPLESWYFSTPHNCACKLLDEQTLWGQTVCRVWLPTQDIVIRLPPSALQTLAAQCMTLSLMHPTFHFYTGYELGFYSTCGFDPNRTVKWLDFLG